MRGQRNIKLLLWSILEWWDEIVVSIVQMRKKQKEWGKVKDFL
jgi:hypothetical protein